MSHKSVCASVPHQRPAEWVASTAAVGIYKKNKKNLQKNLYKANKQTNWQFCALLGVVIQLVR